MALRKQCCWYYRSIQNSTQRRNLGFFSCGTGNPIDDCWRCDPNWQRNRKRLADCGIGFGRNAIGGRDGKFYVVTDPRDDDPVNPKPGTLRHAVIQDRPLWIVFKRDMVIQLKQELIMNSFKTIDGRGANVHIANGACITIQFVTNVIIHGLHIHDCVPTGNAMVRSSPTHFGWRTMADGDAISIFSSSHIWVDHNSLSHCADGLVDAVLGSTAITISNNHFTHHNEVLSLSFPVSKCTFSIVESLIKSVFLCEFRWFCWATVTLTQETSSCKWPSHTTISERDLSRECHGNI